MTLARDLPFRDTVSDSWSQGHLLVLRFRDSSWCDAS